MFFFSNESLLFLKILIGPIWFFLPCLLNMYSPYPSTVKLYHTILFLSSRPYLFLFFFLFCTCHLLLWHFSLIPLSKSLIRVEGLRSALLIKRKHFLSGQLFSQTKDKHHWSGDCSPAFIPFISHQLLTQEHLNATTDKGQKLN